jgi:hypothetical protein
MVLIWLQQNCSPPPHQGRQQPRRRHRTLRARPIVPEPQRRCCGQRDWLHPVRRICHNFAERIPMAEASNAGTHGCDGGAATGMMFSFGQRCFVYWMGDICKKLCCGSTGPRSLHAQLRSKVALLPVGAERLRVDWPEIISHV